MHKLAFAALLVITTVWAWADTLNTASGMSNKSPGKYSIMDFFMDWQNGRFVTNDTSRPDNSSVKKWNHFADVDCRQDGNDGYHDKQFNQAETCQTEGLRLAV